MKREDILKIADRYGLLRQSDMHEDLLDFAAEVAEAEREECAKVCAGLEDKYPDGMNPGVAWRCAEAIMSRGKDEG